MSEVLSGTPFEHIYKIFFTKVTDDMYMEWTREDTIADLKNILLASIPRFEFPRFKLYEYDETNFADELTHEEINILACLMVSEWFYRQILTVDNTRMKYSSSDFKFTSQANHLDKLTKAKDKLDYDNRRLQRLYKRRKTDEDGRIIANYRGFGGSRDEY